VFIRVHLWLLSQKVLTVRRNYVITVVRKSVKKGSSVEQLKYSLKELCQAADVTERTVRYYIKEGLLPPPEGAGPLSRYNYEHWLRLLFIRRLKEDFLPLSEIKTLLTGKTVADLNDLAQRSGLALGEALAAGVAVPDSRLESLLQPGPALLRQQLALHDTDATYQAEALPAPAPAEAAFSALAEFAPSPAPAEAASFEAPSWQPPGPLSPMAEMTYPKPAPAHQFGPSALNVNMSLKRTSAMSPPLIPHRPPEPSPESNEAQGQTWERIVIAPGIELHVESHLAHQHRPALQTLLETARRLLGIRG
jgi:DNA-binding transcriptional MerR regulator